MLSRAAVSFHVTGSSSDLAPGTILLYLKTSCDWSERSWWFLASFFLVEKEHWSQVINSTMDLSVLIKNLLLASDTQASFPYHISRTAIQHRSFQNPKGNSSAGPFQSHIITFPRPDSAWHGAMRADCLSLMHSQASLFFLSLATLVPSP